jgi:hypothetical protein
MAAVLSLEALRARFGPELRRIEPGLGHAPALSLGWPELDALLPDRGLPRGVVELAAPHALGGATSVALAAVRAAQGRDARAWCAWVDPEASLYAPGVAMAGVDLTRLLVVRPPRADLGRIAVKVASAKAFDVVVVDVDPVPGSRARGKAEAPRRRGRPTFKGELFARKLALAAEEGGATVLLLTDALAPRAVPWPVALRIELAQAPDGLLARVAKDRRGRVALAKTKVPLATRPSLEAV